MKHIFAAAAAVALLALGLPTAQAANDVAQIRALEAQFAAAFNNKDLDGVMKVYLPDQSLVVFDVVPPRQYVGIQAYRKDFAEFFGLFKGPIKFTIEDLAVAADGRLGWGHSIQRVTGTDTKGQPIDLTVRVTDVYRKVKGHWLVVHEHVSVPVDIATKTPDLSSKP